MTKATKDGLADRSRARYWQGIADNGGANVLEVDPGDHERVGDAFLHFNFNIETDVDIGAELGAEPTSDVKLRWTRNALVVALLLAFWQCPKQWLAYSRDRNAYAAIRAYFGGFLSYDRVIWAVRTLEHAGLIDHDKTRPSSFARFRSTIRFRNGAAAHSAIQHVCQLVLIPLLRTVRLKDSNKVLIPFKPTRQTTEWEREVYAQNEALRAIDVSLDSDRWHEDKHGLLRCNRMVLNPLRRQLYRVFNMDWLSGGRFYGGFWQGLPASDRSLLRINDQPIVERDYSFLHPQLLAAAFSIDLGESDPYEIPGIARKDAKRGMNILINADSVQTAVRAIRSEFVTQKRPEPAKSARHIIEAIMSHHSAFGRAWGTGAGLRLQNIDAEMCEDVQRLIRNTGNVALSVHDSFLVDASIQGILDEAMEGTLTSAKIKLRRNGLGT